MRSSAPASPATSAAQSGRLNPGNDPLLSVRDLWIEFVSREHSTLAVRGLSFDLRRGMKLGIVGESGSGKSTTALALIGLLPDSARILGGNILHAGRDVTHASEETWKEIRGGQAVLVFQNALASLNPLLSIGRQLADVFESRSNISRNDAKHRAIEMLAAMGMPDAAERAKAYPHQYSGGMAQRALVGLALACSPEILVADEPTSGLDPMIQTQVLDLINRRVSAAGAALILISHDIEAVRRSCTDVVVMYAGEVMERGAVDEVLTRPAGPYTQALLRSHELNSGSSRFDFIAGRVPVIARGFRGCSFSGRCQLEAVLGHPARCRAELPELTQVRPGQEAACHFLGEQPSSVVETSPQEEGPALVPTASAGRRGNEVLSAAHVSKAFHTSHLITGRRTIRALDDVTVSVNQGEILAVIGESGSGKSTLGKFLAGLVEADRGEVRFRTQPIRRQSRENSNRYRRGVQIVFQNPLRSFNPMLTIGSTLKDPLRMLRITGKGADRRVAELLDSVGLDPRYAARHPHQLSGGELQRASIARALATEPDILILDEPTSALDVSVRGQVINVLLELRRSRDLAMLVITHDLRVVRALADQVAVMYLGQIVESGPAASVLRRPEHPYTRALIATAFGLEEPWLGQPGDWAAVTEATDLPAEFSGCRLSPRCAFALEKCRSPQPLEPRLDGRLVRCWRVDEIGTMRTNQ